MAYSIAVRASKTTWRPAGLNRLDHHVSARRANSTTGATAACGVIAPPRRATGSREGTMGTGAGELLLSHVLRVSLPENFWRAALSSMALW